jgi:hypothetical protein
VHLQVEVVRVRRRPAPEELTMTDRLNFVRHEDDPGVDEILFVAPVPKTVVPDTIDEARQHAFLKLALIERYKTSGMSGDEWRFSTGLYLGENKRKNWRLISTGGRLRWHCSQLYPELYGDFDKGKWPDAFFKRKVGAITFSRKGHPVWSSSYDAKPVDLLVAAGHLPWAWCLWPERGEHPDVLKTLCAQPGCAKPHVSIYRLKHRYCREGHRSKAGSSWKPVGRPKVVTHDVRGFCADHLRRGDCGLDDADDNYVALSGPGPDGHEPDSKVVKKAAFGGTMSMGPEGS